MNYNEVLENALGEICIGPYRARPALSGQRQSMRQRYARPGLQISRQCGSKEL